MKTKSSTSFAAALGMLAFTAVAITKVSAVVVVNYDNGNPGYGGVTPSPSSTDDLNGMSPSFTDGTLFPSISQDFPFLTNGLVQPNNADLTQSVFFDGSTPPSNNTTNGRILYDFGTTVSIATINTYSWHLAERNSQNYSVYGAIAPGDTTPTVGEGTPISLGYTLITAVSSPGVSPGPNQGDAQGVFISDNLGGSIGSYRYLLFDLFPSTGAGLPADRNTLYGEFDVTLVPEPSSVGLLGLGALGLMARRRR